jgi:hypothetical protein
MERYEIRGVWENKATQIDSLLAFDEELGGIICFSFRAFCFCFLLIFMQLGLHVHCFQIWAVFYIVQDK